MITSFYSYKGGVGRSQLVANLAAYLCYYHNKRILLIDWDLEAPGLHFYFGKKYRDIDKKGLINLFENYVDIRRKGIVYDSADKLPKFTSDYIYKIISPQNNSKGCIDLIPAGKYKDLSKYKASCIDFDWYEFYEIFDGKRYIEYLKEQLKNLPYDFILIDSRTGLNDYSNICNIQIPDVNVLVVAPTQQNLEGCANVANQIINSPYIKSAIYRKPIVLPIYSRVQIDNNQQKNNKTIQKFKDEFEEIIEENTFPYLSPSICKDLDIDSFIQMTLINYDTSVALWENIVFQENKPKIIPPIAKKYIEIAQIFIDVFVNLSIQNVIENKTDSLDFSSLSLDKIPTHLEKCVTLKKLNLNNNQLTNISGLDKLKEIQNISLSNNNIEDISTITNLKYLQELDLSYNHIHHIKSLTGHKKIAVLNLRNNHIQDILPLSKCSNLHTLDLGDNPITNIFILNDLIYLHTLQFDNTPPFHQLPKSIVENSSDETNQIELFRYWIDNFTQRHKYLREAKVVFVGEGGAGKTSLMDLLLYNKKENHNRTERIEIHTNTDKFTYKKEPLTLYFWDFGGQEIMHATHKFFLTERSVYILVINGRQGDIGTVDKWLDLLQSSSDNSPILLVVNKLDNKRDSHQLPFLALKMQYPQIQGLVETSSETGRGIAELEVEIQKILQTQMTEIFEEPFAPKYFEVKNRLQTLDKNYISYQEYEKICLEVAKNQDVEFDKISQELLADRLNELGIMLNFRAKHKNLEELMIFKPEWMINGIYKIINTKAVQATGKIHEDEIRKLLKTSGYVSIIEQDFIIRMMKYFELAYQKIFLNGINYLIPSTFKTDKPENLEKYWNEKTDVLRFRFTYKIWRNDYVSFFLVNQHERIQGDYFWKNGAILKYGENEVFLEGNRHRKSIEIQVFGNRDKRYALWQVREALDRVHHKFQIEVLGISEWVIYQHQGKNYEISYEELQRYKAKNRIYWISKIDVEVDAGELLGEVELSNKEKFRSALETKEITGSQIDKMINLVDENRFREFFEELEKCNLQGFAKHQATNFRNEFTHGDKKFDYYERLTVFVKNL